MCRIVREGARGNADWIAAQQIDSWGQPRSSPSRGRGAPSPRAPGGRSATALPTQPSGSPARWSIGHRSPDPAIWIARSVVDRPPLSRPSPLDRPLGGRSARGRWSGCRFEPPHSSGLGSAPDGDPGAARSVALPEGRSTLPAQQLTSEDGSTHPSWLTLPSTNPRGWVHPPELVDASVN
jgi:hypothetical protein